MHHALIHEHERGTHGWQLEWLALPQMFSLTTAALKHAVWLSENLQVNEVRMRENVRASHGLMLAEALTAALAQTLSRTDATQLVSEACRSAVAENRHLFNVARAKTNAPLDWEALRDETAYLGSVEVFIDRLLQEADRG